MEEWKEYKLGEIGTVVGGATPSTKEPVNYDGDIAWITPKDLSGHTGMFIKRGERMISKTGFDSCSCKMLPKGSILFSSRAPIGYVAIAENELCTNQGFKSVIPNEELINNIFLYYLLVYNKDYIEGLGSGTTFKEVSGQTMKNVDVKIPSLSSQNKIASILKSLDDKIEVNRKINANLEQQAQALFKSWFVDFEPFKNGEFVESELGMIPKGWRVKELGDVTKLNAGGDKPHLISKTVTEQCKIPIYSNGLDEEGLYGYTNEKRIEENAITISARGTIGDVNLRLEPYCPIVRLISVIPNQQEMLLYLFLTLKNKKIEGVGTTQQQLTVPNFKKEKILIPPASVIEEFTTYINPMVIQKRHLKQESRRLATLRDTLLPKLMSGEMKVNEVIRKSEGTLGNPRRI